MAPLDRTSSQKPPTENPLRRAIGALAQMHDVTTADRAVTWNRGNIEYADVALGELEDVEPRPGVPQSTPVREHGPLGRPGRPRRVHHVEQVGLVPADPVDHRIVGQDRVEGRHCDGRQRWRCRGRAAGIAGVADHHQVAKIGEFECGQPVEPPAIDDENRRLGLPQHVFEEDALELGVDRHVDRPGPGDAEPGGQVVERRLEHRRHAIARAGAELAQRSGHPLGPEAQLAVGDLLFARADGQVVGEPFGPIRDQRGQDPLAGVGELVRSRRHGRRR